MPTFTKRVQVLFSPRQLQQLQSIAEARGQSVGALVREAVEATYFEKERERRRAAVRKMAAMSLPVADWQTMERESIRWRNDE